MSPSSPGAESPDDISLKRSPAIAVEPRVAASVEIDDMEEGEILEEELPEAKEFVPDQVCLYFPVVFESLWKILKIQFSILHC